MTIQFEKLKGRLLANPRVKAEYDALARSSRLSPNCSGLACARACPRPNSRPGWAPANPPSPGWKTVTRFPAPRRCCAMPRRPAASFRCGYRRRDAPRGIRQPNHVFARSEATKQSILSFWSPDGLLRSARNDDRGAVAGNVLAPKRPTQKGPRQCRGPSCYQLS